MYNLVVAGAAGDGIETMAGLLEKTLANAGHYLFSHRDFMSRVRGGHNFAQIRFGQSPVYAHRDKLHGLVAFNEDSFNRHKARLTKKGFILCDSALSIDDARVVKLDIKTLAAQAGNPKANGTVCIGALLKLFGLGMAGAEETLRAALPTALVEANLKALALGYNAAPEHFEPQSPGARHKAMLLTGAEAMSMGALAGGLQFYAAYPMSPSTTLLEFFTKHSEKFCIATEQAEDEIAAANMALGAASAGARAMVGTSGGGFSLMVEALGFAGIAEIPVVMANIMRPGPATGLPTRTEQSDLSFVVSASQGEFPRMVIAVRDHADAFYQTARAFRLAQQFQIPVILLSDQFLADCSATIAPLDEEKARELARLPKPSTGEAVARGDKYQRYRLTQSGVSPLRFPGQSGCIVHTDSDEHDEFGVITEDASMRTAMVHKRARKMQGLCEQLIEPEYTGAPQPDVLLVGFGSTAPAICEAAGRLNKREKLAVGALCFSDVYPLPKKRLKKYAKKAKIIINVEQNSTGQLALLLRQELLLECDFSVLKYDGRQLSVDDITESVTRLCARKNGGEINGGKTL